MNVHPEQTNVCPTLENKKLSDPEQTSVCSALH